MNDVLLSLIVAMFSTIIFNIILKKLHLPTILGYIFTGILLTSLYHINIQNKEILTGISEFGIVFLMFTIGLEFSIGILSSMKKEVFVYGSLQLILTSTIFAIIAFYLFDLELKSSIIIASALSLSSTAIIIKMLNEKGDIQRKYGRKALGILLFQDIAVIPLFIMVSIFANSSANIYGLIWKTTYGAFFVVVFIYFVGKYLLNYTLNFIVSLKTYEIFIATLFFIVVGSSFVAHSFGLSFSLGAFLAGIMISETKFKYQIEADMIPFRDILLGIFFISVGMQIDMATLKDNLFTILAIVITIMIIKFLALFLSLSLFTQKRTAFKTALTLCGIGEFAIVLFELAKSNSLLDEHTTQILLISVIISMIFAPFIINNTRYLADILIQDSSDDTSIELNSSTLKDHIILCGYGRLGKIIAKKLQEKNINFVVVDHDILLVKEAINDGCLAIFGNAAMENIIEAMNLKKAISSIVAIDNEEKLHIVCKAFRNHSKDLHIIANVKDVQTKELLKDSVDHILFEPENTANLLVKEALSCSSIS